MVEAVFLAVAADPELEVAVGIALGPPADGTTVQAGGAGRIHRLVELLAALEDAPGATPQRARATEQCADGEADGPGEAARDAPETTAGLRIGWPMAEAESSAGRRIDASFTR